LATARGITVEHSAVEFDSEDQLSDNSFNCKQICGTLDVGDCNALFNKLAGIPSSIGFAVNTTGHSVDFEVNDCMVSYVSFHVNYIKATTATR
jgi:hypothetical protein